MKYSRIVGTGSYLPPHTMSNHDWEKRVETSHDWIKDRTGIESRHVAQIDETASGMATKAAKKALESANLSPESIELIIVATATPDKVFPATACLVQHQLGVGPAIAFDMQAACSGFIYALSMADQFIKTGQVKHALVIGTELMSRLMDWSDRNTCVLFGDGAGAVVCSASETPGIMKTKLYADGSLGHLLEVDNVQMANHPQVMSHLNPTDNPAKSYDTVFPYLKMNGRAVFKTAVHRLGELIKEIQADPLLTKEPIDWLVPHQANERIIEATAEKLNLPMSKVICTVAQHSNTSSASIPLALDVAVRDGRIQRGQNLLFEAFGGGLTWGSAFVKF